MSAGAHDDAGSPADPLDAWIAASRTALLVIDMQVDFADPDGALGKLGVDLSAVPAALSAAEDLVDSARSAGARVVFLGLQTRAELDSPAWREWSRRRGDGDSIPLCRAGSPGADFYGPRPRDGEPVVWKGRYSGFHQTDLDAVLKAGGVDTLVICGLTTECCIDSTVRDAFHKDYHVFLATDACAAYDPVLHAGAIRALAANCAIPLKTHSIMAAWAKETA